MSVKTIPGLESVDSTEAYDRLVKALYSGVTRKVEEIAVPPLRALAVAGHEPPGSEQFQDAISVLYGVGYTLKMGLKFGKLTRPPGYFDYRVGALEVLWWSTSGEFQISNPDTLRWQAYLMVPGFVSGALLAAAARQAREKHPEVPYENAGLVTFCEGHCVQMLHVGPYDREQPTIAALHAYAAAHGLAVTGKHHEIYISDPGRTAPEKLKTVIRQGVSAAAGQDQG